MSHRYALALATLLAGCTDSDFDPFEHDVEPAWLEGALIERWPKTEVLERLDPTLVARAQASTGQQMELYEYRLDDPPEGQEVYVTLTFADGELRGFGSRGRPTGWWHRLFPDPSYDDPYGPERVSDCVSALEESVLAEGHGSSRTC